MPRPVYLDYNATAPVRPQVAEAMAAALATPGNPSSAHRFGRLARRVVDEARERVAALVGADPGNVVFTSGGTEANALAVGGVRRRRVLVSAVEHESVLKAAADAVLIPVDRHGVVDLDALDRLLDGGGDALVSVMLANNETGVVQPLAEVATLARRRGALVHCDAVQAAGKLPLDMAARHADLLTLSAHKLGGPQGVGALVLGEAVVEVAPSLRGGGQERGRRAGTENVPGIAGFGVAAKLAMDDDPRAMAARGAWRDRLERQALAVAPRATVFGAERARLPNTTCLSLPGMPGDVQVMALDLAGVAVSAGSACSSGKVAPSRVLRAMGATAEEAATAIRISLGWASEEGDVDRFLEAWTILARRAGGMNTAASAA